MGPRSLRIGDESRRKSSADDERIDAIEHGVRLQLRDLADAWGQYVRQVVDDANRIEGPPVLSVRLELSHLSP
jgi:hypothetical protein